ncbi:unnamed protein product [Acanthoscelides obtectus]|uniref:Uncharacterized protein n=1 Tax=Acanthoscelides obtectus TaxID=200917 RepID=A0A9P0PV53_ACAOB|nr:unnamed protein product [Acanthoscelides obtectus]CAK1670328.1 hypothetical protein AOBTE_LOCUS27563 [Acanthoscelides obtectus]
MFAFRLSLYHWETLAHSPNS